MFCFCKDYVCRYMLYVITIVKKSAADRKRRKTHNFRVVNICIFLIIDFVYTNVACYCGSTTLLFEIINRWHSHESPKSFLTASCDAKVLPIWANLFWHLKYRVCVKGVISDVHSLIRSTSCKKFITFTHTGAFLELYIKFLKSNFKSLITWKKSTKTPKK